MLNILLPLQFACQIIGPENSTYGNFTVVQNMSVVTTGPSTIPDGYIAAPEFGVAYKLYLSGQTTWPEARKHCMAYGANLAVLDSHEKISFAMQTNRGRLAPHVGIHRLFDKKEWTSVKTGLALPLIPWTPEPSTSTPGFDCAVLFPTGSGLVARNCSNPRSYICEISLIDDNYKDGMISLTSN